jgi:hypothetical protein
VLSVGSERAIFPGLVGRKNAWVNALKMTEKLKMQGLLRMQQSLS